MESPQRTNEANSVLMKEGITFCPTLPLVIVLVQMLVFMAFYAHVDIGTMPYMKVSVILLY